MAAKSNIVGRKKSVSKSQVGRTNKVANLWIFYSNKNQRLLHVEGDVPFMHMILMEGDSRIASYSPLSEPAPEGATVANPQVAACTVQYANGSQEWVCYRRTTRPNARHDEVCASVRQLAAEKGVHCCIVSDKDLERQRCLFDNWLVLSRAMTAGRDYPKQREALILSNALRDGQSIPLGTLLSHGDCDPALMLALIARQLQLGSLTADLESCLLGLGTSLRWS